MIKKIKDNLWQLCFREFSSCVYVIKIEKWILIDTGSEAARDELLRDLHKIGIEPEEISALILTHSHYDHVENVGLFRKAKVYSYKNIKELENNFPGFKIIKAPGHTEDSVCILWKDVLFSGDVIFDKNQNYVGRTDLPESDPLKMGKTLEKLKDLKYNFLCPGHLV